MGIPFFLVVVVAGAIVLNIASSATRTKDKKKIEDFLAEQNDITIVPRTKLEEINFIKCDISRIKFEPTGEDTKEQIDNLLNLSHSKIANFKGVTNQQLKKTYGNNNFDEVLSYQNNYDDLLKSLVYTAELLSRDGDDKSAISLLQTSISLGNDVTKNYTLLADLYSKNKMRKEMFSLIDDVKENKEISQAKIMNHISSLQKGKHKGNK